MTWEEFSARCPFQLSEQQRAAVLTDAGHTLLLAVPGSGKTTVLLARLGYLIFCKGVAPENILTVTFSVAAAREMKERFAALFGEEMAGRVQFRTLHGLCAVILHWWSRRYGRPLFDLMDGDREVFDLLYELYREEYGCPPEEDELREFQRIWSYCRNSRITGEMRKTYTAEFPEFDRLCDLYEGYKRAHRLMDYDDLLRYALTVLKQYPDVLGFFQKQYPYILLDEAQDTSKIQFEVLFLLEKGARHLFVVGDEDQSIYSFRAAAPEILLEFQNIFPDAEILLMEKNYRSGGKIVAYADRFIALNRSRHPKKMRGNGSSSSVSACEFYRPEKLYDYLEKTAAAANRSTALLFRNNDSILPLLDRLDRRGVEYSFAAGDGAFFTHWMICDLCDMVRFGLEPDADVFLRFYYKLNLYLTREQAETAAERYRADPGRSIWKHLLAQRPVHSEQRQKICALQTFFGLMENKEMTDVMEELFDDFGYWNYVFQRGREDNKLRVLKELLAQNPRPADFLRRMEELACLAKTDRIADNAFCHISTIHSAKGMEFDRVILGDIRDGVLPSWEGLIEFRSPAEPELLEEERRIFYVGVTRARKELEVLVLHGATSRFTGELFTGKEMELDRRYDWDHAY